MLDARQVFRKVTRKICDFSPEQEKNLTSIVWLYRGQEDRFAGLVQSYLATAREWAQEADFAPHLDVLAKSEGYFANHADVTELQAGIQKLTTDAQSYATAAAALAEPEATIPALTDGWTAMLPLADQAKTLIKEIDHLAKLAQKAQEATIAAGEKAAEGKKHLADSVTPPHIALPKMNYGENAHGIFT